MTCGNPRISLQISRLCVTWQSVNCLMKTEHSPKVNMCDTYLYLLRFSIFFFSIFHDMFWFFTAMEHDDMEYSDASQNITEVQNQVVSNLLYKCIQGHGQMTNNIADPLFPVVYSHPQHVTFYFKLLIFSYRTSVLTTCCRDGTSSWTPQLCYVAVCRVQWAC